MITRRKSTKALSQKAFAEAIQNFLGAGIDAEEVNVNQYNEACYILLESPHYKILMQARRSEREIYLEKADAAQDPEERACCYARAEALKGIISDEIYGAKAYVESTIEEKNQKIS